jgi:G3E family GTPase
VDASRLFELKQGCICCTITNEYELVLQELAERFPHVQHLLIETTGIADPAGVIRPFSGRTVERALFVQWHHLFGGCTELRKSA